MVAGALALHARRVGPGPMSEVISVVAHEARHSPALKPLKGLSHLTFEVNALGSPSADAQGRSRTG